MENFIKFLSDGDDLNHKQKFYNNKYEHQNFNIKRNVIFVVVL